jgi:hypothetical protein
MKPGEWMENSMKYLTEKELNTIRGTAMVSHATPEEILGVFGHLDALEMKLDEREQDDFFGTEGWRHAFGPSE